jgi:hypothetical protein
MNTHTNTQEHENILNTLQHFIINKHHQEHETALIMTQIYHTFILKYIHTIHTHTNTHTNTNIDKEPTPYQIYARLWKTFNQQQKNQYQSYKNYIQLWKTKK